MGTRATTAEVCAAALLGLAAATCGGGPGVRGAATPTDLVEQIIAICVEVVEPEVGDFDALLPDAALLGRVSYDPSGASAIRTNPDPAADVLRVRDEWQVILDLLITEDALTGVAMSGKPVLTQESGDVPRQAHITLSFHEGAGAVRITAAQLNGRWYLVEARLEEMSAGQPF